MDPQTSATSSPVSNVSPVVVTEPQPKNSKNKYAIAGLILGLVGLIAWIIPLLGAPVVIIGLVLSLLGLKSSKKNMAIVGLVLSIIGLVATTANAAIGAYLGVIAANKFVNQVVNSVPSTPAVAVPNSTTTKSESIIKLVNEAKSQVVLPMKIDAYTDWTSISAEPEAIKYVYSISDIDTTKLSDQALKNSVSPNLCQSPQTRAILDQGIAMKYLYTVKGSNQTFSFTVNLSDCK